MVSILIITSRIPGVLSYDFHSNVFFRLDSSGLHTSDVVDSAVGSTVGIGWVATLVGTWSIWVQLSIGESSLRR